MRASISPFLANGRGFGLLGLILVSLALVGCQPKAPDADGVSSTDPAGSSVVPSAAPQVKLRIAVIPKGTTHVFWKSVHYGAQQAADELGVEIQWRGPQKEDDRDQQISVVQSFVSKAVDGIVLAPLDSQALVRPVREAKRAGIPTVIFDSGLDAPEDVVSYVATDNRKGGAAAADALATSLGGAGKVVLLRYNQGSESTLQREEGFLEQIKTHPGISVLSSDQYAGTTTESSLNKAQQMFNRYGEQIDGIFAVCEPNADGVLRCLEDLATPKKVQFVGFDPSERLRVALSEGRMSAMVLQDPVKMGYEAVKAIVAHLRNQPVEKRIDTGQYVATTENHKTEPFNTLLNPPTQ
jgi:ribose transport system substrate-binding protein